MANEQSDEHKWSQWMIAAQAGDQASYALLLEELGGVIGAYLRSRFGDLDLIEDCVQESLLAIHGARHTFDKRRLFRPWMFAIVRHKAIDMLRRRQTYSEMLSSRGEPHNAPSAESEIESGELLGALAPKYNQALTLTKIVGLSIAEAAHRLGISESAMKVRVHRGLGAMRKLLESEAL